MTISKDPQAVLDYGVNWATWLGADTITTSTWAVNDPGLTINSISHDTTTTTVWLSGGTVGATYALTNHVTTTAGRQDDRTITVRVGER